MPNFKSEIKQGSPEALAAREKNWQELDKFIPPENREYQEISAKARAALSRWRMALEMEQGWPIIQKSMEELGQLYERATQIRGETAYGNVQSAMRGKLNVPPNQPVFTSLEAQIDKLRDYPAIAPIADELKKIISALGENPKESLGQKNGLNNTYYRQRGASFIPDFGKIDQARSLIKRIRESPMTDMYPEVGLIVNTIEAGIEQVEGIDPVMTAGHKWLQMIDERRKPNYYGLRVLGGISGALISGLGLVYSVIWKKPFTWPIAFWGGVTAVCANPNLLKGRIDQAFPRIGALYTKTTHELINGAFRGKKGAEAFDELQDLATNRPADLKALIATDNPSPAQIGALVDNQQSPLLGLLSQLSPEKRCEALRTFGQRRSSGERDMLRELMTTRDSINT